MFEVGFNECNLAFFESLLPEQFEFYHDKDGVITSRSVFIKTLKDNLCSSGKNTTKRVLKDGSLEVFPLRKHGELYGAILTGRHNFGNTIARFTHLFLIEDGEWLPFRMMSYDHKPQSPEVISDITFIQLSLDELARYLGDYEFSADFTLSIIEEQGRIYGDAQGQKVEIKPYGDHRFLDDSQTTALTFISNESGSITGLKMASPEGVMIAKRLN